MNTSLKWCIPLKLHLLTMIRYELLLSITLLFFNNLTNWYYIKYSSVVDVGFVVHWLETVNCSGVPLTHIRWCGPIYNALVEWTARLGMNRASTKDLFGSSYKSDKILNYTRLPVEQPKLWLVTARTEECSSLTPRGTNSAFQTPLDGG